MISPRYVLPTCALLVLALVPTIIHSYSDNVISDGRSAAAIPRQLTEWVTTKERPATNWGRRHFDTDDWVDRTYVREREEAQLTVVRSFDAKRLYHHPEHAITDGTSFTGLTTQRFSAHPEIPVHVLVPRRETSMRAFYVLHYDDRFVADPLVFQIRTAGELLFSRRKPMTLFFVNVAAQETDVERLGGTALLWAAIDDFLKQPTSASVVAR